MAANYTTVEGARVGVLLGSASDWPTMSACSQMLSKLGIAHECNAISAHRNHERLAEYIKSAEKRQVQIFICAAGGAAHLGGVVAAITSKPVLGCPMKAWSLEGLDSLLSMVQMPKGVPVATFAIGGAGAVNAAVFAATILALGDDKIRATLQEFRRKQSEEVSRLEDVKT
jgi:5-(carboxyamino)imidazole ribonucleotide mutase